MKATEGDAVLPTPDWPRRTRPAKDFAEQPIMARSSFPSPTEPIAFPCQIVGRPTVSRYQSFNVEVDPARTRAGQPSLTLSFDNTNNGNDKGMGYSHSWKKEIRRAYTLPQDAIRTSTHPSSTQSK